MSFATQGNLSAHPSPFFFEHNTDADRIEEDGTIRIEEDGTQRQLEEG